MSKLIRYLKAFYYTCKLKAYIKSHPEPVGIHKYKYNNDLVFYYIGRSIEDVHDSPRFEYANAIIGMEEVNYQYKHRNGKQPNTSLFILNPAIIKLGSSQ